MRTISALLLALLGMVAGGATAAAQAGDPLRPHAPWNTLHTEHFEVHYPAGMARWTHTVAARLDSIHTAVSALVGNAPDRRVTVVVADPYNLTNGFALPLLRTPTIVLWPTPPEPRSGIGEHRDWGELLAVHEYAHVAHLAWPSRNARDRRLWSLLPVQLGPITRRSPRWVTEGYATYVEGRLTGSGRPHGTWRPTTLRQWALEGRLPTYAQLSAWDAYQGGAMAYLVGSAFLEWLVEQRGEESLNHLWRRMTAVQRRSFADAFAGVFGGPPDELYGRFTLEITREALAAERQLRAAEIVEGEQIQRLSWHTGDPALSPDGSRIAIVLRQRDRPSRVVVWRTEEPEDTVADRARERLLERDPLDVAAIEWRPRPKQPVATLHPVAGRAHDSPRFLPDGRRVLVTRQEPLPDGHLRPDLFVWDTESGALRRVTRGAAIRHPDPSPDGRRAVAARCEAGICDLVRIDLRTGRVDVIHRGSPDTVFHRPRYSPDGIHIAVAVQAQGRWRVARTDDAGGTLQYIDPDDGANRYDASWFPHGRALVMVSHRGGVPNLERIDLVTGEVRPVTRTTGAAVAPEPNPADGSVFFLRLHTRGLDLHHIHPDTVRLASVVDLEPGLHRVAPTRPAVAPDSFPQLPLPEPRPYRLGPRAVRLLPAGAETAEGRTGLLTLAGTDPIGRLGWTLSGAWGDPGTWRGMGLSAAFRGALPALHGELWHARQQPAAQSRAPEAAVPLGVGYTGSAIWTEAIRHSTRGRSHARLGASLGSLEEAEEETDRTTRQFAFAELGTAARLGTRFTLRPSALLHVSAGRTMGEDWQRWTVATRMGVGRRGELLVFEGSYGALTGAAPPVFEEFTAGGAVPLLFNPVILPQRIPIPAVPLGVLSGARMATVRASAALGSLQPYFLAARANDGLHRWYRVVGAEQTLIAGPVPLARLPEIRLIAGFGYPLDEPLRHRPRGYLSLGYRP
ncbi:hypothetical protein BH23GEM3_BH23GEM3_03340 [soil metagenome]